MERKVRYRHVNDEPGIYQNGTLIEIIVISSYTYGIVVKQDGTIAKVPLEYLLDGDPKSYQGVQFR